MTDWNELFEKENSIYPLENEQIIICFGDVYSKTHSLAWYRRGGFEINSNGPYSNSVLYPFFDETKGNAIRVKAWKSFEEY